MNIMLSVVQHNVTFSFGKELHEQALNTLARPVSKLSSPSTCVTSIWYIGLYKETCQVKFIFLHFDQP
jgi:hypothetical protein